MTVSIALEHTEKQLIPISASGGTSALIWNLFFLWSDPFFISYIPCLLFAASNMAVKNYPREFVVFSGFNVNEFANKGYLKRINLLKDRFVGKKRVFRVRLHRGDNTERMLISFIEAEELLKNYSSPLKKRKGAASA